ncbi:MAG TPA: MBL fold metallo-hydrolase [Bryobacteraceae bacterium]|nr:MBL fold metallo-hydrolase [Bryobacteraceae bacterium]
MPVSTRRTFLKAAAAGVAAARYAAAQSPKIAAAKLDDDIYLLSGAGANVLAHTAADGVLLVDGGLARNAPALAQAVAALPNSGPVKALFNTHWHPEQTGSNEALGMAGATIIAHENTRLWLTQNITWPWNGQKFQKLPKIAQPNKTFYDKGALESGIRYGYLPDAAHTDGDLYVYFPRQNILAVGGAAYGEGWPMVDWWTGGWIGGMAGVMRRLMVIANKETRIVPAQGPVLGYADITAQAEMYETIFDRLNQMLNKGRGPDEAVAAKPAKEFEAKMGNSDEFIRMAFESQWAYLSPDA